MILRSGSFGGVSARNTVIAGGRCNVSIVATQICLLTHDYKTPLGLLVFTARSSADDDYSVFTPIFSTSCSMPELVQGFAVVLKATLGPTGLESGTMSHNVMQKRRIGAWREPKGFQARGRMVSMLCSGQLSVRISLGAEH